MPTIMWWPGRVKAGSTCVELATTMDLLPTFAKLAGGATPVDRTIDGHDIAPLILDVPGARTPYKAFYYYYQEQLQAVRSGPWKLFLPLDKFVRHPHFKPGASGKPLLFNVEQDIASEKNVAVANPKIVKRLAAFAAKARADLGDLGRKGKGQRPVGTFKNPQPRVMLKN